MVRAERDFFSRCAAVEMDKRGLSELADVVLLESRSSNKLE